MVIASACLVLNASGQVARACEGNGGNATSIFLWLFDPTRGFLPRKRHSKDYIRSSTALSHVKLPKFVLRLNSILFAQHDQTVESLVFHVSTVDPQTS